MIFFCFRVINLSVCIEIIMCIYAIVKFQHRSTGHQENFQVNEYIQSLRNPWTLYMALLTNGIQ